MEYANIVWGGSYDIDISKLEAIHLDALHLITGATARSNIANIHSEICNYTMSEWIRQTSLTMMFKIVMGEAPQYLTDILIQINAQRNYVLHNNYNIQLPYCRLETYKRSFFPRVIALWNDLTVEARFRDSTDAFKKQFAIEYTDLQILYYYGKCWPSIHHARMRIGCSKLNSDLCHNLHVIEDPSCRCGAPLENAEP